MNSLTSPGQITNTEVDDNDEGGEERKAGGQEEEGEGGKKTKKKEYIFRDEQGLCNSLSPYNVNTSNTQHIMIITLLLFVTE